VLERVNVGVVVLIATYGADKFGGVDSFVVYADGDRES